MLAFLLRLNEDNYHYAFTPSMSVVPGEHDRLSTNLGFDSYLLTREFKIFFHPVHLVVAR